MTVLLLALAMLQASPNSVRLDCEIPPRIARRVQDGLRLLITLDVEEGRIASVLVDGPPVFSSYRRVRTRHGSGGDAPAPQQPELLPRNAQWHGSFQGRAIRLRRESTDMVLEPAAGSEGAYTGFWTYVEMAEYHRVEANGSIRCRTIAGTLNEGARS
jgi:hypothetical protein